MYCNTESITISNSIGVCAYCLRKGLAPIRDLHAESRVKFNLPSATEATGGLRCGVCGRGCEIPSPEGYPRYASFFEFFIDLGKALGMPGYGEKGIPGAKGKKYEGRWFPLNSFWDYILRIFANGAADAQARRLIPKDIPDEDVRFVEENYPIARFKAILPPDEWRAAAYALARGGIFTRYEDSFDEKGFSKRSVPGRRILYLWSDVLARTRNSVTGKPFWGGPRRFEEATYAPVKASEKADKWLPGTPLRKLYPESEYPFILVFESGPLYTKHRGACYFWIKQILPENFAVINPEDAKRLGINTGDIIRIESPSGYIEAPALVEPTVARGVIIVPYGMGRWAETLVVKPSYLKLSDKKIAEIIAGLPEKVEIPAGTVNPVKKLPPLVKKILFTGRDEAYYETGLKADEWIFSGVTPNPIQLSDPSLGSWPIQSWIGAAQVYYFTPVRITKTGMSKHISFHHRIW